MTGLEAGGGCFSSIHSFSDLTQKGVPIPSNPEHIGRKKKGLFAPTVSGTDGRFPYCSICSSFFKFLQINIHCMGTPHFILNDWLHEKKGGESWQTCHVDGSVTWVK